MVAPPIEAARHRRWAAIVLAVVGSLLGGCGTTPTTAPLEDRTGTSRWRPPAHQVVDGETLYAIAWRHDLDFRELARWNGLQPPYTIVIGQQLALGPGAPGTKAAHPSPATALPKPQPARTVPQSRPPGVVTPPASGSGAAGPLRWHWPAKGPVLKGYSPRMGENRGVNIGGTPGDPVVAAADGVVVYAGNGLARYGNLLIIKHSDTYLSAYAHCDRLLTNEGTRVSGGQPVATLGATGTDRTMLHFEIRRDGQPVDPVPLLGQR